MLGISVAQLLRCLSNFKAIGKFKPESRDFTRSCGKTSVRIVNRSTESVHIYSVWYTINLHTLCWSAVGCEWGTTFVYFGITYVCFIPSRHPVFAGFFYFCQKYHLKDTYKIFRKFHVGLKFEWGLKDQYWLSCERLAFEVFLIAPVRGFWSWFGGVCSLTYCNGNFRVTMVSEPFSVIL